MQQHHHVNHYNRALTITPTDAVGPCGAHSQYTVSGLHTGTNSREEGATREEIVLLLQNGPPKLVGNNGLTPEVLIAIAIDRFEGIMTGDHASPKISAAISNLKQALKELS